MPTIFSKGCSTSFQQKMQQTGTLRKRKRRNLSKVSGLGMVEYDPSLDTFTGRELFDSNGGEAVQNPFTVRTRNHTALRFTSSYITEQRRQTPGSQNHQRITRIPSFHSQVVNIEEEFNNGSLSASNYDRQQSSIQIQSTRPYFLDKTTMQKLKQLIWLGRTTGAVPWTWNEKTHRIDKWGSTMTKLWWVQCLFFSIQTFLVTGYQIYFFRKLLPNMKTYRQVFMASLNTLWYSYALIVIVNMYFYKEATREFVNTLFAFNYKYVQKYLIHLDGYKYGGGPLIHWSIPGNIFQVLLSLLLFLAGSYQPWYLFSYIYPKPWYWMIPFAFQQYMVTGQVVTSFSMIPWIIAAHENTVGFWMRETHKNNDSDYTSDELRDPKNALECYRTLQVLNKCLNEFVSPLGMPFVKFATCTAIVICGFLCIRSMNHYFWDEFPVILSFPLSVFVVITAGFVVLKMGAEVHDLSSSFVDSWSQTQQKDLRRILLSCPTLKLWTAKFYYVTPSTTITCFKASFDVITDCVIAFPQ